jgi:hypothetical protein
MPKHCKPPFFTLVLATATLAGCAMTGLPAGGHRETLEVAGDYRQLANCTTGSLINRPWNIYYMDMPPAWSREVPGEQAVEVSNQRETDQNYTVTFRSAGSGRTAVEIVTLPDRFPHRAPSAMADILDDTIQDCARA